MIHKNHLGKEITDIKHRIELPQALMRLGLNGFGVEIGVDGGAFSQTLVEGSKLQHLFAVDIWRRRGPEGSQLKYLEACNKLAPFRTRVSIIRMMSVDAAEIFRNEFFDFVYIDANHEYQAVVDDIAAWWPKLKAGGVFAGHDYWLGRPKGSSNGVQEAVDEFAARYNLALHITTDNAKRENGSWITQKPIS